MNDRSRNLIATVILLAVPFTLTAQHTAALDNAIVLNERETHLATIPARALVSEESFNVSPDGTRVVYIEKSATQTVVVANDKTEGQYTGSVSMLTFSPDSKRLAFRWSTDTGYRLVLDGNASTEYSGILFPTFSSNSARFAYAMLQQPVVRRKDQSVSEAMTSASWVMVVDGKPLRSFRTKPAPPVFSPDSRHIAFIAQVEKDWRVVHDGEMESPYEAMAGDPVFSPDSKRLAYIAKKKEGYVVVLDGRESSPFEGIGDIVFSPDSHRLAFMAGRNGSKFLVIDGKEGPVYDGLSDYGFSPDSRRTRCRVMKGAQQHVIIDGKESPGYDAVSWAVFSAESKRFACVAGRGGKQFLVIDGVEGTAYDKISEFLFSPDGKRIAYAAEQDGRRFVINNGKEEARFDAVAKLAYSPDSSLLAYAATQDKETRLVVACTQSRSVFRYPFVLAFESRSRVVATIARHKEGDVSFFRLQVDLVHSEQGQEEK